MWQKQVEVFEKNKKEAQEQGNMAMNIFEIMTGGGERLRRLRKQ